MTYPTPEVAYTLPQAIGGISVQFVQASMVAWLDQTNAAGGANGTPVAACQGAPLPVQIVGGSAGGTFTDASVAPDGPSATQPTSATQLGFWNGTGFVPAQTGTPFPVQDALLATAQAGAGLKVTGTIADSNSASVFGVVPITPGTAITPLRGIAFICTTAGNITLTLADGSTMTFPIAAGPALQVLGFSVGNITLGSGTTGTFWGTK